MIIACRLRRLPCAVPETGTAYMIDVASKEQVGEYLCSRGHRDLDVYRLFAFEDRRSIMS
jgi:hypothetical protein